LFQEHDSPKLAVEGVGASKGEVVPDALAPLSVAFEAKSATGTKGSEQLNYSRPKGIYYSDSVVIQTDIVSLTAVKLDFRSISTIAYLSIYKRHLFRSHFLFSRHSNDHSDVSSLATWGKCSVFTTSHLNFRPWLRIKSSKPFITT
jgi:hypothetical protein